MNWGILFRTAFSLILILSGIFFSPSAMSQDIFKRYQSMKEERGEEFAISTLVNEGESGSAEAKGMLAWIYMLKAGDSKDFSLAAKWGFLGASQNDGLSQYVLGELYFSGAGVEMRPSKAREYYELAAKNGIPGAQLSLAKMIANGRGGPKDIREAKRWYAAAAEHGMSEAEYSLGFIYEKGLIDSPNPTQAAEWYMRAINADGRHSAMISGNALNNLALMYWNGHGVTKDRDEAIRLWRKAADGRFLDAHNGQPDAKYNLAQRFYTGVGLPKDFKSAFALYLAAAVQGQTAAQYNLGVMYWSGEGVDPNFPKAYFWWLLSAAAGNAESLQLRNIAEKILSSSDQIRIQAIAKTWAIGQEEPSRELMDVSARSTLEITKQKRTTGTGFFVSGKHVVTSLHVVDQCSAIADSSGRSLRVVASDSDSDLALLSAPELTGKAIPIRQVAIRVGESATVIGFPMGGTLGGINVTTGNVSATRGLAGDDRVFQFTAPVQLGHSGSPVLDSSGYVSGLVESKINALAAARRTGDIPQNVNFATYASVLTRFLDTQGIAWVKAGNSVRKPVGEVSELVRQSVLQITCN